MNHSPTVLIGNVTNDPELAITTNGQARLSFSVAVNYVWYDNAKEKQEKTSYFNITAWRYTAENAARVLEKGIGVIVTGRLEQRTYETKEGEKRSTVELVADEIAVNVGALESVERRKRSDNGDSKATRRPRQSVPAGADEGDDPF